MRWRRNASAAARGSRRSSRRRDACRLRKSLPLPPREDSLFPPLPLAGEGRGEGLRGFVRRCRRIRRSALTLPSPASGRGFQCRRIVDALMTIQKAAVIGAGVMGSGIAAQIANAGIPVVLLDIVPKGAANRNAIAEGAVARLLKSDPAAFMHPKKARLVTTGNLEDHLDLLKDCDWIVEAVLEDPGIKRTLYRKLDAVRKPGSVVSSNTSTIPLALLVKDMPPAFQGDFLITHFFNPPRYMRLLELVAGPATRPDAAREIADFCDVALGKGVVRCKDRPGFIANRIGGMWIQAAINAALDLGLTVEKADAVMGRPFGMPKTGIFALLDLVGIDLMPHVAASMKQTLPEDDPYIRSLRFPPLFQKMID